MAAITKLELVSTHRRPANSPNGSRGAVQRPQNQPPIDPAHYWRKAESGASPPKCPRSARIGPGVDPSQRKGIAVVIENYELTLLHEPRRQRQTCSAAHAKRMVVGDWVSVPPPLRTTCVQIHNPQ